MSLGSSKDEHFSCFPTSCQTGLKYLILWTFQTIFEAIYKGYFLKDNWNIQKRKLFENFMVVKPRNTDTRFRYKGLVFCRNNDWLMKNMDKGLAVPKWALINWQKIPQKTPKVSVQIAYPSPKVLDFDEKVLHWASIFRGLR